MTDSRAILRFAPSPTGVLHLGHAYSALFTSAVARRLGGRFLVRIEDIDAHRCRPEFEAAIYDDLAWLGLEWPQPVRRQSDHLSDYTEALAKLRALGVSYPSFASRREIAEAAARLGPALGRDPDGAPLYPGLDRSADPGAMAARAEAGEPHAIRLDMAKALALASQLDAGPMTYGCFDEHGRTSAIRADPSRWGDVLLASRDRAASYHLAVVTDDARQGVTHVTRGADLLAATDIHRLLQILLGLPAPLYRHHRLILDPSGRKLSKSHRDTSLASLRTGGVTAAQIRRDLGLPGGGADNTDESLPDIA
jgi:glutamyl-Q tRNA(Asp) synthetase